MNGDKVSKKSVGNADGAQGVYKSIYYFSFFDVVLYSGVLSKLG